MRLIEFECHGHRLALPLACVRRAVPSAQPAPLPAASGIVLGVLNVAGEVVTVIDFCHRLGLPASPIVPSQQMLMIDLGGLLAGWMVDRIAGVTERELDLDLDLEPRLAPRVDPLASVPGKLGVAGIASSIAILDDGLLLVVDPEKFLFDDEQALLASALAKVSRDPA